MSKSFIKKRFEKIRDKLTEQHIPGAIITSKPNQQYLLGFTSESPMMLFVPGSDQDIRPTIFTSPLEENIVKDNKPFSELDVKVIFKDITPRAEKFLHDKKYWTISLENTDVYVPHFLLHEGVKNFYASWLAKQEKSVQFSSPLPEKSISDLITEALEQQQIMKTEWEGQIVVFPRMGYDDFIIEILQNSQISKLGLELTQINYQPYQQLTSKYHKTTGMELKTVNVDDIFLKQRIIKDPDELKIMREAAEIGTKGFLAAQKAIHEFKSENEVQAHAEFAMKIHGSKKPAFETIVVSGENSVYPHGHATNKLIEKGDLVTVDIGAVWQGYNSDMTRTIFAGEYAPEESLKLFKLVNQAHAIGLSHVKPGVKWGVPDVEVRKFFKEHDVLQYYNHSLGHGVGVEVHEMPAISSRAVADEQILKEGMVLTIEPGLYIPGVGGARTEDTVVVTADGYEKLTICDYLYYN